MMIETQTARCATVAKWKPVIYALVGFTALVASHLWWCHDMHHDMRRPVAVSALTMQQ